MFTKPFTQPAAPRCRGVMIPDLGRICSQFFNLLVIQDLDSDRVKSGIITPLNQVVNAVKTIASNNIAAAANTVGGWTAGQPAWRKSYTPVGQSGCYSKCRPRMRPLPAAPAPAPAPGQWNTPKPMIGYQSSCRTGCNMREEDIKIQIKFQLKTIYSVTYSTHTLG